MSERLYAVVVTQDFGRVHVVRASSKREARAVITDLAIGWVEPDDPRIVESYPTGTVGTERVSTIVTRVPDQQIGSKS